VDGREGAGWAKWLVVGRKIYWHTRSQRDAQALRRLHKTKEIYLNLYSQPHHGCPHVNRRAASSARVSAQSDDARQWTLASLVHDVGTSKKAQLEQIPPYGEARIGSAVGGRWLDRAAGCLTPGRARANRPPACPHPRRRCGGKNSSAVSRSSSISAAAGAGTAREDLAGRSGASPRGNFGAPRVGGGADAHQRHRPGGSGGDPTATGGGSQTGQIRCPWAPSKVWNSSTSQIAARVLVPSAMEWLWAQKPCTWG